MTDYSQGKIYMIKSKNTKDVYIGSTKYTLEERFYTHMMTYYKWLRTKKEYCTSFEIIKYGEPYIELLEDYPCETKNELELKEGEYQRMIECVNQRVVGRTEEEKKEYIKNYYKEYHKNNEKKDKEYRNKNKERKKEYDKEYNKKYRNYKKDSNYNERKKEYDKQYQIKNKEKISEKRKIKFKCVCGIKIRIDSRKRHEQSKVHIQYIEEMKEKADATNLNEFFEQFKFKLTTN